VKFERTALAAMRLRAEATGSRLMSIEIVSRDLGAPADFGDVLSDLHRHGLITLHRDSEALTLMERGYAEASRKDRGTTRPRSIMPFHGPRLSRK